MEGNASEDTLRPKRPGDEVKAGTDQSGEHLCPSCGGTGRLADQPCPECRGSGRITVLVGDA